VLHPGLIGFDGDAESLLQEDDELQRADGIQDAAGDQRRRAPELVRVLARQELPQDVLVDDLGDVFHDGLVRLSARRGDVRAFVDRTRRAFPIARSGPILAGRRLPVRRFSVNVQFPSRSARQPPKTMMSSTFRAGPMRIRPNQPEPDDLR
jgi:hypothetical protein